MPPLEFPIYYKHKVTLNIRSGDSEYIIEDQYRIMKIHNIFQLAGVLHNVEVVTHTFDDKFVFIYYDGHFKSVWFEYDNPIFLLEVLIQLTRLPKRTIERGRMELVSQTNGYYYYE